MPRPLRTDVAGVAYHVLNRSNARVRIFSTRGDYEAFEQVLDEVQKHIFMDIFAYCIMPNHWHFVVRPKQDGDLSRWMHWITLTHTQRWHAFHSTTGSGHLYQGRYKSFPVQTEQYFLQVCRYVESNPLRSHLVERAEDWQWSSLWTRCNEKERRSELLQPWPVTPSDNYIQWVNEPQSSEDLEEIRTCTIRSRPYGDDLWRLQTAQQLGIEMTLRPRGRPQKKVPGTF
jgi:putative transposase